ncbi:hypothetical protein EDB85DRAFT_2257273 [Lactarius pseudohatsudake]|nr:hypothetical protein EDB85DRAFT_2257273 [Lactarius pseudohatsudake]
MPPAHTFFAFTSTFKPQFLITIISSSSLNMHSYKTLAVIALAVSTASPALSAPVVAGQQRARANFDERASALPIGIAEDVGSLIKTVGTNLAFGALPVALEHFLNSTRRALPDDAPLADNDKRAPGIAGLVDDLLTSLKSTDSLGKVIKNGLIGGAASGVGAAGANALFNNNRREPSPFSGSDLSGVAKTLAGALISLGAADGVKEATDKIFNRDDASPQDLIDALQRLGSRLDELD